MINVFDSSSNYHKAMCLCCLFLLSACLTLSDIFYTDKKKYRKPYPQWLQHCKHVFRLTPHSQPRVFCLRLRLPLLSPGPVKNIGNTLQKPLAI